MTDNGVYCWGYSPEVLRKIQSKTPCRKPQIQALLQLFGERHHSTIPSLFLYGHTATGKSYVINTLLTDLQLPHVRVNCVECYNPRFLYEHILNNLPDGKDDDDDVTLTCDNMNDFVRMLGQLVHNRKLNIETLYLVLDKAERLREMDANILSALLRLQELSELNICVILVTEIVWEKFRTGTGVCEPYILHFPDYNIDELTEVMSLDCPVKYRKDFFMNYVSLVLSVFHLVCRDLQELRHIALLNFSKYVEPIENGEAKIEHFRKLWKNIEPHLKKSLQTIYLREISSSQWERLQNEQLKDSGNAQSSVMSTRSHVELPYYSKYLLIAAYLASYNPVKSDRRLFVKHTAKTYRKQKAVKKAEKSSNHLLGPKPFPLDRLFAIFYSIVEGRVAPTAHIYSQITSLVSLHLLGPAGSDDQIDMPKYKCLVSLDFIRSVSRTVNFDVMRYLYDFM
ncbi:origin recognition complex subunit 5-like [Gigantopelta aegis]|uniref:origin recognition complex subunit 5-like n=1 Tax=Gigantopelta aegis TaxID=1735272 RepID=UPI001B88DAAE|nr:origin recognition complex subunit 5-like [Gigantopelta aegis]